MKIKIVINEEHIENEEKEKILSTAKSLLSMYTAQYPERLAEAEQNGESVYIDVSNVAEPVFFR